MCYTATTRECRSTTLQYTRVRNDRCPGRLTRSPHSGVPLLLVRLWGNYGSAHPPLPFVAQTRIRRRCPSGARWALRRASPVFVHHVGARARSTPLTALVHRGRAVSPRGPPPVALAKPHGSTKVGGGGGDVRGQRLHGHLDRAGPLAVSLSRMLV